MSEKSERDVRRVEYKQIIYTIQMDKFRKLLGIPDEERVTQVSTVVTHIAKLHGNEKKEQVQVFTRRPRS